MNKILKYQLDVDQILYSKDKPDLKKRQLILVVSNLKKEIERESLDETNVEKYKENLKLKLPNKESYDNEQVLNLFVPLINEYFESRNNINRLLKIVISGGLSISYIDSEEIQGQYLNELRQVKLLQEKLKKIEEEKKKQIETEKKIENKIKAVTDAAQKKIYLGDKIQCRHKLTKNQIGVIKDINYIPGKIYAYTVELIITNELGEEQKENLSSCKLLTTAEEEAEKKKQELIDEKTDFLSKQVAKQYGFKIGDPIDCTTKDGKNISGVAKKFIYNLLKRKTYVLIAENEKLTQINVKYCANQYDFTLKNINKTKERTYMKKQFSKLQEIIKKINKLNPNDENYEFIIKDLTHKYDTIESQINNTMQSTSDSSSNCSEEDKECKSKTSPRENPAVRISNTENEILVKLRNERIALLQLLEKLYPKRFKEISRIAGRQLTGIGGHNGNKYTAELNQKNIKFKNGKLPILNTVKGGYNTFGLTQKYIQRAGNPEENINDIINNSNNLLTIMDKTLL